MTKTRDSSGPRRPLVIGHRGACGYVPEHTLASYFIAIEQGADFVEPDLVMTQDGVLVARHENEIGATTDVAERREFAGRRATKQVDGVAVSGWFTEDFTLAELKSLRARERIPEVRPGNTRFDGQFQIPTFEEILAMLRAVEGLRASAARQQNRPAPPRIGIYPETKHPSYFARLGLAMETPLVNALHQYDFRQPEDPAFIQCFETANLKAMRRMTPLRIVQLIEPEGAPYDCVASGDPRTYQDLLTPAGLAEIATYANAIGPYKMQAIPRTADDSLGTPEPLIENAHAHGLLVHAWTFRAENRYLPRELRAAAGCTPELPAAPAQSESAGNRHGNLQAEILVFLRAGLDGFFADQPDLGAAARDAYLTEQTLRRI